MRIAFGNGARMPASLRSTSSAAGWSFATPTGKRISVRTSISSQSCVCRTLTMLLSISGFIARFTSSEIWLRLALSVLPTVVLAAVAVLMLAAS